MPKTAVLDCCLAHATSFSMKIVNITVYLCLIYIKTAAFKSYCKHLFLNLTWSPFGLPAC